eukprot:12323468-Ditylum_brightwellii.AAC.1
MLEEDEMEEVDIPVEEWEMWEEKVTAVSKKTFPCLNMQLFWTREKNCLSVYSKENQQIKYVNKESCHCSSVFKAIPAGFFT